MKFVAPLSDTERQERFKVLELRGVRVLVEFICEMSIRPTFGYLAATWSLSSGLTTSRARNGC